ncbi:unnamed protein product [Lupinus luteus]|uniref:Uncharacterized protein n=1 Tax=Lupinus luteus TaxID=3873 RepID=A0AAV1XYE6_LUPLU
MGNCLVLQENVVRIMKIDGKILEYKIPIKVEQVLKEFSGHAVYDSLPFLQHLHPNTKLVCDQFYYLVPLPTPQLPKAIKKVRFSDPEVQESRVVRVKIVISKKELHDMLQKEGISVEKMLSRVQNEKRMKELEGSESSQGRKLLRLSVENGGCSGFQYVFNLDHTVNSDGSTYFCYCVKEGIKLVVDNVSYDFVKGATVDYVEELIRSAFVVTENPSAVGGCSCKSSFMVK